MVEVCRDYYQEVWIEALNLARVPVASEWRKAKNIYYPPDIHEAPAALLGLEQMLPLRQPHLINPLPPKSLFLLLGSPKGLARLVAKARGRR